MGAAIGLPEDSEAAYEGESIYSKTVKRVSGAGDIFGEQSLPALEIEE
jgi:hypothetical protein